MAKQFWLMKTEPVTFSWEHLKAAPKQISPWDGVRNYQARNFMRDGMRFGDQVLFYHSSCDVPGVAGVAKIVRTAYDDPSALDPKSPYYDARAKPDRNPWCMVDVAWLKDFKHFVPLTAIREHPGLQGMRLVQRGNRLSVMPVTPIEFKIIASMGNSK